MGRKATSESHRPWRSSIPRDTYERVLQLACDIVNASATNDRAASKAALQRLRRYWQRQEAIGRCHPFLPETVADMSGTPRGRIALYRYALRLARRINEQRYTILLSLGEVYLERGDRAAATRCFRAAHDNALLHGNREAIADARRALGLSKVRLTMK